MQLVAIMREESLASRDSRHQAMSIIESAVPGRNVSANWNHIVLLHAFGQTAEDAAILSVLGRAARCRTS